MKACIIQPPYSRDLSLSDEYFDYKLARLAECDASLDIIVLPEYSDVPCATETLRDTVFYHERYIDRLLTACAETAVPRRPVSRRAHENHRVARAAVRLCAPRLLYVGN